MMMTMKKRSRGRRGYKRDMIASECLLLYTRRPSSAVGDLKQLMHIRSLDNISAAVADVLVNAWTLVSTMASLSHRPKRP